MIILTKGESMLPTLQENEKYEIDKAKMDTLKVGDIIVFKDNNKIICHRIYKVFRMKSGNIFFQTKGDNCIEPDTIVVTKDMIIGKLRIN
ncbi:MAG: signal peptidase I [Eisenbergiella sp.]